MLQGELGSESQFVLAEASGPSQEPGVFGARGDGTHSKHTLAFVG